MSIITKDDELGQGMAGGKCFFCHQDLGDVSIMWAGTEWIWLHPACALDLIVRLMRDVHEYQWSTKSFVAILPDDNYKPYKHAKPLSRREGD